MNKNQLLKASGLEHIDNILFKRESVFLLNIIHNISLQSWRES